MNSFSAKNLARLAFALWFASLFSPASHRIAQFGLDIYHLLCTSAPNHLMDGLRKAASFAIIPLVVVSGPWAVFANVTLPWTVWRFEQGKLPVSSVIATVTLAATSLIAWAGLFACTIPDSKGTVVSLGWGGWAWACSIALLAIAYGIARAQQEESGITRKPCVGLETR